MVWINALIASAGGEIVEDPDDPGRRLRSSASTPRPATRPPR